MSTPVTLEEVLHNKEVRVARQQQFLARHGLPLVSISVNIPGAFKSTSSSNIIFEALFEAFKNWSQSNSWNILETFTCKEKTGPESLVCVDADALALKTFTCKLENEHPLGRFIDMDVIDKDGRILSRTTLGEARRTCYLCDDDAVVCGRSRKHSIDDLTSFIDQSVMEYHHD